MDSCKKMKPFTDTAIVKECMIEEGYRLFENKQDIVHSIRRISFQAQTLELWKFSLKTNY